MFIKYGDRTDSCAIEKTAAICEACNEQKIIINGKLPAILCWMIHLTTANIR